MLCMVEGVGFEPTKPRGARFTVWWFKPLTHPSQLVDFTIPTKVDTNQLLAPTIGAREGSRTHQPADYKSAALPLRHSG